MTSSETTVEARPILLATDLSSRCDRAFERACALAAARGVTLHVVTAVEGDFHQPSWRSSERQALAKMRADVTEALGNRSLSWEPVVVPGRPRQVIVETARRIGAGLIVVGVARNELLGRASPGKTVETLIREAPAPVLVVRRRAVTAYRQVLLPTDYSHAAELALIRAAAMFPEAQFILLHGYRVPFAGFLDEGADQPEFKALALEEQSDFISRVEAATGQRGRFVGLVEYGGSEELVVDFVGSNPADLLVIGAHDHGGILGALSVDVAGRLLMAVRCDVLVVPEAAAQSSAPRGRNARGTAAR